MDEDILALVHEARPVTNDDSNIPASGVIQRRVWRETRHSDSDMNNSLHANSDLSRNVGSASVANPDIGTLLPVERDQSERDLVDAKEGQIARASLELSTPLIQHRINVQMKSREGPTENFALEGIGLGSSGAIKPGLGDFIFYSVLVGRAAMYDFMTVLCMLSFYYSWFRYYFYASCILLESFACFSISVLLGVLFYLLTGLLLETFIVQCSINLLML